MVGLAPLFEGDDRLYAYAIGVVVGTLVQLLMMLPTLRRMGFPLGAIRLPRRDDERVLARAEADAPGVDRARADQPQRVPEHGHRLHGPKRFRARSRPRSGSTCSRRGCSVSRSRPSCSPARPPAARNDYAGLRATIGTGMRQIGLLLIPAGAAMAVLAEPLVRLVFERGEWDAESTALTADALFWFAFSLPFSGWVLMLTRGFFSLQQPTTPTKLAVGSLAINAVGSYPLSKPFGIAGIVLGTIASNVALVLAEAVLAEAGPGRVRDARDAGRGHEDARRRRASWRAVLQHLGTAWRVARRRLIAQIVSVSPPRWRSAVGLRGGHLWG